MQRGLLSASFQLQNVVNSCICYMCEYCFRPSTREFCSISSSNVGEEKNNSYKITNYEKTLSIYQEEAIVYVHWPFCKQLCTFCNFNKYVRANVDHDRMKNCLVKELKTVLKLSGAKKIKSVYFGGGTPSLAKPSTISAVLDCVANECQMDRNTEVSLEANPSSLEKLLLRSFKDAGINRLSLGIQSLCSKDLVLLGRDHTVEESLSTLEEAKTLFPGKVSIDLLFGRPQQTVWAWENELKKVLPLCDTHLSLYQLTLERGTPLYKSVKAGSTSLPSPDIMADLYQQAVEVLEHKGLHRYEVSSFAIPGHESQHNMSYWSGVPYIGIGPGAHSRYFQNCEGKVTRFACVQTPEPNSWMQEVEQFGHATRHSVHQSTFEILEELLISGLRTKQGLMNQTWSKFAPARLGNLSAIFSVCQDVKDFIEAGLLIIDHMGIRASPSGLNVIDSLTPPLAIHLDKYVSEFAA